MDRTCLPYALVTMGKNRYRNQIIFIIYYYKTRIILNIIKNIALAIQRGKSNLNYLIQPSKSKTSRLICYTGVRFMTFSVIKIKNKLFLFLIFVFI